MKTRTFTIEIATGKKTATLTRQGDKIQIVTPGGSKYTRPVEQEKGFVEFFERVGMTEQPQRNVEGEAAAYDAREFDWSHGGRHTYE